MRMSLQRWTSPNEETAMRTRPLRHTILIAVLALAAGMNSPGVTAQEPCRDTPGFDRLDFWIGEWDVMANGQRVGTNRILEILDGCAVVEEWSAAGGGEGRSIFYYLPHSGEWKQVWVTTTATRTGGVKEKTLIEVLGDGSLRFQGRLPDAAGQLWYDRTTLTPRPDGTVRQHLEISQDGRTWETTFDAVYVRRGGNPADLLPSM